MVRVYVLGEEGGSGQLHACSSKEVVARYAANSPLGLGGDAGFEVPGASVGDLVHLVKLVSSGAAYDALGVFKDKAAAEALANSRKRDGGRVTSLSIE